MQQVEAEPDPPWDGTASYLTPDSVLEAAGGIVCDALPEPKPGTLHNADAIDGALPVCWGANEADILALQSVGMQAVALVPDGDRDVFAPLRSTANEKLIADWSHIVIAGGPPAFIEELARRLGRHRVWRAAWPDGCADAASTMQRCGAAAVRAAIDAAEPYRSAAPDGQGETTEPLRFINPRALHGQPIPARQWIVDQWLPVGCVTLLYGDGGTGKSLVAQQLMTACATARPWLGMQVTRCRALAMFCEDDPAELHRRQDGINRALSIDFDALDRMTWASAIGADNALIRFRADAAPELTGRLADLRARSAEFGAGLIVIDTAADAFADNENDRAKVRAFIGALNQVAQELGAAVLVNAHPSRAGLSATGDLDGGSTAWSNTARCRWSLTRPAARDEPERDTSERLLACRKSNYGPMGDTMRLRWHNGVLAPVEPPGRLAVMARQTGADAALMALLAKAAAEGRHLSDCRNAGNFAPKQFAKRPDSGGFTQREFEAAMQRLFAGGKIVMAEYGRPSAKGRPRRMECVEGATDA